MPLIAMYDDDYAGSSCAAFTRLFITRNKAGGTNDNSIIPGYPVGICGE